MQKAFWLILSMLFLYRTYSQDTYITCNSDQKWLCEKLNDSLFSISIHAGKINATGYAKSIAPLIKHGEFVYYSPDNDIKVKELYKNNELVEWYIPTHKIEGEIFNFVAKMPHFEGGDIELLKFLRTNFNYKNLPKNYNNTTGRPYIRFIVDRTGKVINPQIARSVSPEIDNECLRTVAKLPNFIPGYQNGNPVNIWMTIGIDLWE